MDDYCETAVGAIATKTGASPSGEADAQRASGKGYRVWANPETLTGCANLLAGALGL